MLLREVGGAKLDVEGQEGGRAAAGRFAHRPANELNDRPIIGILSQVRRGGLLAAGELGFVCVTSTQAAHTTLVTLRRCAPSPARPGARHPVTIAGYHLVHRERVPLRAGSRGACSMLLLRC